MILLFGCNSRAIEEPVAVQIMTSSSGWPAHDVEQQKQNAEWRFAQCGIQLEFVSEEIETSGTPHPLHFVDTLTQTDGKDVEGRTIFEDGRRIAMVAFANAAGIPLDHNQTAAHELGHMFGLSHSGPYEINLMAPYGCEFCRFTAHQCDLMRSAVLFDTANPSQNQTFPQQ